MRLLGWTAPGGSEELMVQLGPEGAAARILVLPAWFDEANKTRHFTLEVMRHLEALGVASALPDLPGCNESLVALSTQMLATWQTAASAAAEQVQATHVLAMRAAVVVAPDLPGWAYASTSGKAVLRGLVRSRIVSSREAGIAETSEDLLAQGQIAGLSLAGYLLGAQLLGELADHLAGTTSLREIPQSALGGAGLWLRAEPDDDAAQARNLAELIARDLAK